MIGIAEILILSLTSFLIYLSKCIDKMPPPIYGIYEQKTGFYWLKTVTLYIFLTLVKIKNAFIGQGRGEYGKFEKPQKLPGGFEKATDIVTFNGANKNGDFLVLNFGNRPNITNGYLLLKIGNSDMGVLSLPNFPNAVLAKATEDEYEYSSEGLKIVPMEPLKKWRIIYKGKMIDTNNKTEHDVKIDGLWTTTHPPTDPNSVTNNLNTAKCLAYENWDLANFKRLLQTNLDWYQQRGILQLKASIGSKNYDCELDAFKVRMIGGHLDEGLCYKAALHQFTTEKGDYFTVGQFCIPVIGSRISVGVAYNKRKKEFYPVTDSSFELYKHGGLDVTPDDYGFTFKANQILYAVLVKVKHSPYVYSDENKDVKNIFKMCEFDVNGRKGWGIANWMHRNIY